MLTQSAGAPSVLAPAPLAARSTIVPAAASPTIHPATKAGPFTRASGVVSIRTTAMIGIGLSATPTPNDRTWPIACPTAGSLRAAGQRASSPLNTRAQSSLTLTTVQSSRAACASAFSAPAT